MAAAHEMLILLCTLLGLYFVTANDIARGFSDDIAWVKYDDGLVAAQEQKKPIMMLIHKSWCGACKALKPHFTTSQEIKDLSQYFVMMNVMDDEEPTDQKYFPDGGYIPRILFMDHRGNIKTEIVNEEGNDSYKYYYPDPSEIVTSMKKALKMMAQDKTGLDEL